MQVIKPILGIRLYRIWICYNSGKQEEYFASLPSSTKKLTGLISSFKWNNSNQNKRCESFFLGNSLFMVLCKTIALAIQVLKIL